MWQPAFQPTNFQTATLPQKDFYFTHGMHGTLRIRRLAKGPGTNQINFALRLITPLGQAIHAVCHVGVDNNDQNAYQPPVIGMRNHGQPGGIGISSVGYGDINLGNLTGRHIIYAVHYAMAVSGSDIGVAMFVVESIVNPGLNTVCQNCGMRWAVPMNAWQGACGQVKESALATAQQFGWQLQ